MKIVTFQKEEKLAPGVLTDQGVLDVSAKVKTVPEFLEWYGKKKSEVEEFLTEAPLVQDAALGPCVDRPEKIICSGLNYQKHADRSGMDAPDFPLLFNKFGNALTGPDTSVTIPADAKEMDYEAELAIVIGKEAKHVKKEDALKYVAGFSPANDLTARDLQFRTKQWLLGKSPDGFLPLGPYVTTADEAGDPDSLHIQLKLNGELRQDSNTSDLIFDCATLISYISDYMTLKPGDVILTGTPEGVIMELDDKEWLKDGDEVEVSIEGLGTIKNTMRRL
ncbi:fumarylacetoacetate hydrolase family protein [Salimicrobium halophilum]|uniref:2-keto-4-pentenoate hydratase/2-oxohepta-3-ene-1,7-dioic acid hydratase (Catechol pathway) n=1 Tax=Salimicrobium halophilum TaxID=86666 RepID=A0A1G8VVV9_9BACI|nr:fumarylacetoacetate hydrolase family protein [Salimicrobium halophilum]SDJ70066.1 2-keto-4-pentenoate hydratase/2-oxohepta-3-ene-1,7-dioic acid hydratase (catechol pathway) [Salimicrobium halophilum]